MVRFVSEPKVLTTGSNKLELPSFGTPVRSVLKRDPNHKDLVVGDFPFLPVKFISKDYTYGSNEVFV